MENEYTFFDLDHTLVDTDCERAWKHMLINQGIAVPEQRKIHDDFLVLHHEGRLPLREYTEFMMQDFIGKTRKDIAQLAIQSFENSIKNKIFSDAKRLIASIKENGGKAVILSGSFEPIVVPVAQHLEMDDVICTTLETHNNRYNGNLIGEFCIKEGKVKKARDYCTTHNVSLADVNFYGDSHSDVPMMEQVGNATVVNAEGSMHKLAKAKDWNTVVWTV